MRSFPLPSDLMEALSVSPLGHPAVAVPPWMACTATVVFRRALPPRVTVTSMASRAALPEVVAPWLLGRTAPRLPPEKYAGSASAQDPAQT